MREGLSVAVAQPRCAAKRPAANIEAHAEAVRSVQARVVVFPELSITGYELDAEAVSPADPVWRPLIEACAATGALALVGAPIPGKGDRSHIAMLRVDGTGVEVAYRKMWLSADEAIRFTPGEAPTVLEIDGWRMGLGICKDTGTARHVAAMANSDLDVYVAGMAHTPAELPEQGARGMVIARACRAYVAFASFAGPTGDVFSQTAGHSGIWAPDGHPLATAGAQPGETVTALLT